MDSSSECQTAPKPHEHFAQIRGPQYRPKNAISLTIGTQKGMLNVGKPPHAQWSYLVRSFATGRDVQMSSPYRCLLLELGVPVEKDYGLEFFEISGKPS